LEDYPSFSGIIPKKEIIKTEILKLFSKKINPKEEIEWNLVNDYDIPLNIDLETEQKYIELFKLEGQIYDCIVLITHLLEIKCIRLNSVYIAEKNVTNMDLMMLKLYFEYYTSLLSFEVYDDDKINKSNVLRSY
jgi:hypothetical protein